jgi:hypothetical protein
MQFPKRLVAIWRKLAFRRDGVIDVGKQDVNSAIEFCEVAE